MEKVNATKLRMKTNDIHGSGNLISWEENGTTKYALSGPVYPIFDDVDLGDDCYGAQAIDLNGQHYLVKWRLSYTLDERFDHHIEVESLSTWSSPAFLYRFDS